MSYDYSKLLGKIKEKYKNQEEFAKALNISRASLSAKLNCKRDFSQDEINEAVELLGIQKIDIPDYFFTLNV